MYFMKIIIKNLFLILLIIPLLSQEYRDDTIPVLVDEDKLLHKIIRPTGIPAVTLLSPKMEIITLSSRGFNHAFDKLLDILEENNE